MKNWSGFQHINDVAQVKEQSLAMILNFLVIIADGQRPKKMWNWLPIATTSHNECRC